MPVQPYYTDRSSLQQYTLLLWSIKLSVIILLPYGVGCTYSKQLKLKYGETEKQASTTTCRVHVHDTRQQQGLKVRQLLILAK